MKPKINYFLNLAMALAFLVMGITGIIKFLQVKGIFNIDYNALPLGQITLLHDWFGIILISLILIHLILHWSWIKNMTKNIFKN